VESLAGDVVVRYDAQIRGWVVVDTASGEVVGGPFSQIDHALGTAHSFAAKNHVRVRPDTKYKRKPERSNER
jgi:hypothetical protein